MSKVDYAVEYLGLAIEAAASLNVPTIVIPTDVAIALRAAAQSHSERRCQCALAPIRENRPNVCLRCGLDIKDDAAQSHSTPNTRPPA